MITIRIDRQKICSGNVRTYIQRKVEKFERTFDTEKEFNDFLELMGRDKFFVWHIDTMEVIR